ncbi:MAG: nucleotidyl transferase AbiEii/AbiGii toxin family protein [Anaerolineae bacterium]
MNEREFTNKVTNSQEDFLQEFLDLLGEWDVPFCVIGGLAVNAYAEPVVSLDLDLVVTSDRVDALAEALEQRFTVHRFPHSINVSSSSSDLRIQIQTDPKYQGFIARAARQIILGYEVSVAALEDVLQGKVWAFSDSDRRPSKRQKDLADIMRLVETHPHLIALLPEPLREQISSQVAGLRSQGRRGGGVGAGC